MGYNYYADGATESFPHRFANRRDRDAWVEERPMYRWWIPRAKFIEIAEELGEFIEHENEDFEGVLLDWDGDEE